MRKMDSDREKGTTIPDPQGKVIIKKRKHMSSCTVEKHAYGRFSTDLQFTWKISSDKTVKYFLFENRTVG